MVQLGIRSTYRKLARRLLRPEEKLLRRYLDAPGIKKLHIGCGDHLLEGWLNCDLADDWQIMRGVPIYPLDATKRFPLANSIFDAVFSEHMIEHVPYTAGCSMLRECFRVLKRNGAIRIATPDMRFLIDLYNNPQDSYIRWSREKWGLPVADRTFVINNFFRSWSHQFIYDEPTLSAALSQAGFVNVVKQNLQESKFEDLRGVENEDRAPPGFIRLETVVLEANKP